MRSTPRTASRRETGAIGKILLLGRRAKLESGAAPLFFEQSLAVVDNDGNQETVTRFDTSRTARYRPARRLFRGRFRERSTLLRDDERRVWNGRGEESILRWI